MKRSAVRRHYLQRELVMNNILVVISVLVLLPMIPAYVLFKVLRSSKGELSGMLGSFKVALSGAFAGYFALTVFIFTVAQKANALQPADPVWHVQGTIQFEDGDGTSPEIKYRVLPPDSVHTVDIDRRFHVDVPLKDHADIPRFYFTADGYVSEDVTLADPGRPGNYRSHMQDATTLVFDEPIVLRKKSATKLASAGGQS
jgi:hypothetical protein